MSVADEVNSSSWTGRSDPTQWAHNFSLTVDVLQKTFCYNWCKINWWNFQNTSRHCRQIVWKHWRYFGLRWSSLYSIKQTLQVIKSSVSSVTEPILLYIADDNCFTRLASVLPSQLLQGFRSRLKSTLLVTTLKSIEIDSLLFNA